MHLNNVIKYTILTTLQRNALKISLEEKRKKKLQSRKQIDLRLLKRHKNYLRIQM